MHFLLPGQKPRLLAWESRSIDPRAYRDRLPQADHDLTEVTLGFEAPGSPVPGGAFELLESAILAYDIFGPSIGEPVVERVPVRFGDCVGLRFRFLGFVQLFFASRVDRVFRLESCPQGWTSGFTYRTLEGHPEVGEETFQVIKQRDGAVVLRIEAWSRPNLWYVRLFAPLARWIQKRAAKAAVAHLAEIASQSDGRGHVYPVTPPRHHQSPPRSS